MTITWEAWLRGASPEDGSGGAASRWAETVIGRLGPGWTGSEFRPTDADRSAAWKFYTQLRSRIVTRPLPYLDGDEKTALKSAYDLFEFTRQLCDEQGPECRRFSDLAWTLLNDDVRPVTAKWHKRFVGNRLREDDRREFREDLEELQDAVRYFEALFLALSQLSRIEVAPLAGAESAVATVVPSDSFEFARILYSPHVDATTARDIYRAEARVIRRRRGLSDAAPVTNISGLALSGGGLRSATFALGALQGLAKRGMLVRFDYLSTVSGGGYAGSLLSSFLNTERDPADTTIGLCANQLPFRRDDAQESAAMRHLRSSSKSLLAGGFWRKLEIPVLALLGWLASVAVALPPIVLLTLAAVWTNHAAIQRAFLGQRIYDSWAYQQSVVASFALIVLIGLIAIGVRQHWRRRSRANADLPAGLIAVVGVIMLATIALLGWLWFPYLAGAMSAVGRRGWALPAVSETAIAAISAALIPVFSRLSSRTRKSSRLRPVLSAIALGVLPIVFIAMVAVWLAKHSLFVGPDFTFSVGRALTWLIGSLLLLAFCVLCLNVNAVSLHPFYRDRIARAYHLTRSADGVAASSKQKLSELRRYNTAGPYHLINAALNAPAGTNQALRGRIADFFLFSSEYCGSETTGYRTTAAFECADPSLDLGTAVAISGAAASPFMGVNSSRFNFWASLLNVRLDYWLPVPDRNGPPSPGAFYWLRHYVGAVHDATAYVNLSDGGHIENMGLYELLRRRCRYIVLVDGECDPGITCGSLLQAIRYAKIDFGIEIEIDLSRLKVAPARATTESGEPAEPLPRGAAASPTVDFHFALGRITYPQVAVDAQRPPCGLLLYLKSSISGNEGKAIENYREREPEFPHQSTGDLAYDEEQFECYRALGEHIVDDAFRRELTGGAAPQDLGGWLQGLASRLLRPAAGVN